MAFQAELETVDKAAEVEEAAPPAMA